MTDYGDFGDHLILAVLVWWTMKRGVQPVLLRYGWLH